MCNPVGKLDHVNRDTKSALLMKVENESSLLVTTGNLSAVVTTYNPKIIGNKKFSLSVERAVCCFYWDSTYL